MNEPDDPRRNAGFERPTADAGADREPPQDPAPQQPPPRPRKGRVALVAVGLLLVGGLIAFLAIRFRPEPERQQAETPPPLVEVVRVRTRPVALDVGSQGTVQPVTSSTLVAQVGGRIVATDESFADGGFFRRGEVLVQIDPRDYELAVQDAQAAVAQAELALEREQAEAQVARQEWEELGTGEPNALVLRKPQLAEARSRLEAARAAVERARLNLERTRVTAPFDGRVRSKQADLGQYVGPGTPVAEVFATGAAEVRLPVAKEDLAYLPVGVGWSADGNTASAPPVALRGELGGATHTWSGRIVRTGAQIDDRTRMLDVFARVDDPLDRDGSLDDGTPPLPMGLFVEAEIAGRTTGAAAVLPRRALRTTARTEDSEVLVVDAEDRLHFRPVEVLRAVGDELVVGDGLSDGDLVVVSRLEEPVAGMKVRTAPAEPAAEGLRSGSEPEDRPRAGAPQKENPSANDPTPEGGRL